MNNRNEQTLLNIIRYAPSIFAVIFSLTIVIFIDKEHQNEVLDEKQFVQDQILSSEKKRLELAVSRVHSFLKNKEATSEKKLKEELKNNVQNGYKIIENLFNTYKNTKSKDEIEILIKEALRQFSFNEGRSYFFIYDLKGRNILHPKFPNLENSDLWNYQDAKGTYLIQEMNRILSTQKETFYSWYWYKTNQKKEQFRKVGFFKKFEPLNLFIGAGDFIDDYTAKIQQEALNHIRALRYPNNEYVFAINYHGEIIANKHLELEGKNLFEFDHLEALQQAIIKLRNEKESKEAIYIHYDLTLNDNRSIDKLSNLQYFKNWQWIIGMGINLNTISNIVKEKQHQIEKKYAQYHEDLFVITLILLIVLLIVSYFISKYIEEKFLQYKTHLENKTKALLTAQQVAHLGDWELDITSMKAHWSKEILHIMGANDKQLEMGPECLKELMHPDDFPNFQSSIMRCIKEGIEHKVTYRIYTLDNHQLKWIQCIGQLDKEHQRIVGTFQDITELKNLELEKLKQEELLYQQSKMAAMGEMLGNIAHQWRQPLSTISTIASGIQMNKQLDILDDELIEPSMKDIQNSVKYLSQTIDDFRDFFKPEKEKSEVNIQEVIEKTLKLVVAQFKTRDIHIIKDTQPFILDSLENELIQVLINLLNNARDALENKKQYKCIFIELKKDDNNLTIKIRDNAGGIPKNIIEKVFEPYFTTKHKGQGTGIGLYMSQEIIRRHMNGVIKVSNVKFDYNDETYLCAEFSIVLPIQEKGV